MIISLTCIQFPKHMIAMPLFIITDPHHGLKRDSLSSIQADKLLSFPGSSDIEGNCRIVQILPVQIEADY
jgi:hypothetical protein